MEQFAGRPDRGRSRRVRLPASLFIVVPVALIMAVWGGALSQPAGSSDIGVVRFMTYNIHWGLGTDGVHDLDRIADVLRRADADIVVLTEVDVNWRRSGNTDQPAYLAKTAGYPYSYFGRSLTTWASGTTRVSEYGNLILSRFPIVHAQTVALPRPVGREPRSMAIADVLIDGELVTVVGTHLGLNERERLVQVTRIRELIGASLPEATAVSGEKSRSVVLMGDFNARPSSPEITRLTHFPGGFIDTYDARHAPETQLSAAVPVSHGHTFPYPVPYARIDYIFVSPDLADNVIDAGPLYIGGSDHLPVIADIAWPTAARLASTVRSR